MTNLSSASNIHGKASSHDRYRHSSHVIQGGDYLLAVEHPRQAMMTGRSLQPMAKVQRVFKSELTVLKYYYMIKPSLHKFTRRMKMKCRIKG